MKIKNIKSVGKKPVYDLSVENSEHYVLENGVVTHNTGIAYSADYSFIVGRRQVKDGTEVVGYDFILNADKSRFIKEKSALPYSATFERGVDKYSGLLDIALLTGHVTKPKQGWYTRTSVEDDKNWRRKESSTSEFWELILNDPTFDKEVQKLYSLSTDSEAVDSSLMQSIGEGLDPTTGEI